MLSIIMIDSWGTVNYLANKPNVIIPYLEACGKDEREHCERKLHDVHH